MGMKQLTLFSMLILLVSTLNSAIVLGEVNQLQYDPAGNLIEDNQHTYEYDGFNHLRSVSTLDGTLLEEYWYDEEGIRVKKIKYYEGEINETTYYISNVFERRISDETTDVHYFYADNTLVGRIEDESYFYNHPDHLGSTALITDGQGAVVEKTTYYPFGAVLSGGESDSKLYTGQEQDETGLSYYNARYYASANRQFTQPDELLPNIYDPQQLNRYSYVRNNPYKYTDPSGNAICGGFCIGAIAVGVTVLVNTYIVAAPHIAAYELHDSLQEFDKDPNPLTAAAIPLSVAPGPPGKGRAGKTALKQGDNVVDALTKTRRQTDKLTEFQKDPNFNRKSKELMKHGEVTVNSFDEANALRRQNFPNVVKKPGAGPKTKRVSESQKLPEYYSTDYLTDPKTGRIYGSSPTNAHTMPHINVVHNTKKYVIKVDKTAGTKK